MFCMPILESLHFLQGTVETCSNSDVLVKLRCDFIKAHFHVRIIVPWVGYNRGITLPFMLLYEGSPLQFLSM